jgi:hypothetical protein
LGEALGLVIQDKKVLVDHASKEHLVTTSAGNPKRYKVANEHGDLNVLSIFTRLKATSRERRDRAVRQIGDNCPMIYALKGKDGLTTGYRSVREMLLVGAEIVAQAHQASPWSSDTVIVCVPSSHSIVGHVARQLERLLKFPIVDGLLSKASVASAIADLERAVARSQNYQERKDLRNILRNVTKQEVLALKDVSARYRHLIQPMVLGPKPVTSPHASILLVDDLVSSGTSLIAAKNVLLTNGQGTDFTALSLFSKT